MRSEGRRIGCSLRDVALQLFAADLAVLILVDAVEGRTQFGRKLVAAQPAIFVGVVVLDEAFQVETERFPEGVAPDLSTRSSAALRRRVRRPSHSPDCRSTRVSSPARTVIFLLRKAVSPPRIRSARRV